MASPLTAVKFHSTKADGTDNAAGRVFTYAAGTTTPQVTYTTPAAGTPNANPVILDGTGRASIYLDPSLSYKFVCQDSLGASVPDGTVDNWTSPGVGELLFSQTGSYSAGTIGTKLQQSVCVEDSPYSASGGGAIDATSAIQSALNSGAKIVNGKPGSTYLVSYVGTQTVSATAQRYCLLVPSGVIFNLNGATLKAAAASNASPVMIYSVTDSGVIGGVIDCNKANQGVPATGEIAAVYAYGCTRPRIENIKAINCRMYAGRLLGNTGGRYRGLWCTDSDGDGWSFGVTGAAGELREFESEIDDIHAESCTAAYGGGFQGNPAIFCTKNANIGKVVGKYSAGGVKVQDMAEDTNVAQVVFIGQTNGSVNSGFKVQGNGAGLQPKRIKVGSVNCTSAYGNGLFIADALSVEIAQYHGLSNGTGGAAAGSDKHDFNIDVPSGGRVVVGAIDVETPAAQFGRAFGAGYCKIGTLTGKTPTGIGFSYVGTGEFDADDIRCNDGGAAMTLAFQATGGKGHIKSLSTDKAHSTGQSRVTVNTGLYDWTIDRIRLGSTDVLEGAVQLTNAATSTSVTCGHIWSDYVGGVADTFTPIIEIAPMETTARALNSMYAVPVAGGTGTGFAIKHAAAGAGNYVAWKVLAWKTLNRPFA